MTLWAVPESDRNVDPEILESAPDTGFNSIQWWNGRNADPFRRCVFMGIVGPYGDEVRPDRAAMLKQEAREAWDIAISSDTENVALQIQPTLAGYFR